MSWWRLIWIVYRRRSSIKNFNNRFKFSTINSNNRNKRSLNIAKRRINWRNYWWPISKRSMIKNESFKQCPWRQIHRCSMPNVWRSTRKSRTRNNSNIWRRSFENWTTLSIRRNNTEKNNSISKKRINGQFNRYRTKSTRKNKRSKRPAVYYDRLEIFESASLNDPDRF